MRVCVCVSTFLISISQPDINECVTGENDCDKKLAKCTNTFGGFNCTCILGYEGTGKEGGCKGKI